MKLGFVEAVKRDANRSEHWEDCMKYTDKDYADKRWIHHEEGLLRSAFSVTVGAILALALIIWLDL